MVDARATRTTLIAGKIVRLSVPQMGVKGTECSLEHKTQPWTKVFVNLKSNLALLYNKGHNL